MARGRIDGDESRRRNQSHPDRIDATRGERDETATRGEQRILWPNQSEGRFGTPWNIEADGGRVIVALAQQVPRDDAKRSVRHANARLLAAAYTSYDRACGPRAIEAAESNLLADALTALEKLFALVEDGDLVRSTATDGDAPADLLRQGMKIATALKETDAVLARATVKRAK